MTDIATIREVEELADLLERSRRRPVWLFKHSVTCGISAGARRRFEEFVASRAAGEADYVLLEVQHARPLSNAVAEATGVRHQSPQVLLLRSGEAVWTTSHGAITAPALARALAESG